MKWAYGVTTVPSRLGELLPRTLASLAAAGFDRPRLFVDGARDARAHEQFGLEVTVRHPVIRTFGNWALALAELYIREPLVDRYALFQDDLVACRNMRGYLEQCVFPERGYWNLYTFPSNQRLAPAGTGWYLSNQRGQGAVALVFSRAGVVTLLTHPHLVVKPQNARNPWKSVDGGVFTAYKQAGWREWVHNPSLVQHTGKVSSIRNRPQPLAVSFRGEGFDAMELLQ